METVHQGRPPGIFVSHRSYLSDRPGGVQRCTGEYQKTLEAAGFDLTILAYETNRDPWVRLRRKLWPRPYEGRLPSDLLDRIVAAVESQPKAKIFLNQGDLAPLAEPLKARLGPEVPIILLSHGLESTDLFHSIRTRHLTVASTASGSHQAQVLKQPQRFGPVKDRDRQTIAHSLISEWQHRQWIDQVFCLSAFELELERWLGAQRVTWLPRIVEDEALDWRPNPHYLGFVGTLNHSPNREGLLLFLQALQAIAPAGLRLRLVGGPARLGAEIARQYPVVDYLGPLDDGDLAEEACQWAAMVHPLFCYPRGCSTKLAVALGWQIPVLTTPSGCRGYQGAAEQLLLAETPPQLAQLAVQLCGESDDPSCLDSLRQRSITAVRHSPTLEEVAGLIRNQLDGLPGSQPWVNLPPQQAESQVSSTAASLAATATAVEIAIATATAASPRPSTQEADLPPQVNV